MIAQPVEQIATVEPTRRRFTVDEMLSPLAFPDMALDAGDIPGE